MSEHSAHRELSWHWPGCHRCGNLVAANNKDGRVYRSYYPNGALKLERQIIRKYDDTSFSDTTTHRYELQYEYDLNGRRTAVVHPAQLRSGASSDRTAYTYDEVSGRLAAVTDLLGNVFTYGYDDGGRLISREIPGGASETYRYDRGERLRLHEIVTDGTPSDLLRSMTFQHDLRNRIVAAQDSSSYRIGTAYYQYTGLGHLDSTRIEHFSLAPAFDYQEMVESFRHDAHGHLYWSHTYSDVYIHDNWYNEYDIRTSRFTHQSSVGRVADIARQSYKRQPHTRCGITIVIPSTTTCRAIKSSSRD